jgi:DNA-binding Lrp family transcriptional regulator
MMDDLDHRLVALLRIDARMPIASLASELGVSRATIRSRIDRLLHQGVISGFTIALRDPERHNQVRAIVMITVEGCSIEKVTRQLVGYPEVRKLHSTNGRWDIVAEIVTDTLANFDALLNRIRLIDGISSTETSILLSSPKDLP